MVRYFYLWTPVFIVLGTILLLTSPLLALIALPFVLLLVLALLAWVLVGVPYMVARAVARRLHAHGAARAETAAVLSSIDHRD